MWYLDVLYSLHASAFADLIFKEHFYAKSQRNDKVGHRKRRIGI
jgi:hypothetical protein